MYELTRNNLEDTLQKYLLGNIDVEWEEASHNKTIQLTNFGKRLVRVGL